MDNLERLGWEYVNRRMIVPRKRHKPSVAARIARLNPCGVREGYSPRGWHPSQHRDPVRYLYDLASLGSLIRKHGREILDRIPRAHIVKYGKRKYVTGIGLMEAGI